MARSKEELKQLFNDAKASNADMDEYINAGHPREELGEKSKAFYDERKKLLDTSAAQPASDSQDVSNIKLPSPVMPISGNSGYTINDEKDAAQARKNIRKLYANDNVGYKNAIKETGVDVEQDPNARYKMKSIQQAYYDGEIDKNTRDYLLADTIGKFARNMGKDVGNIAAAYSGGTVNNEREASNWDARNAEMMKQGVSAEAATVENSDKQMERAMQKIQQTAGKLKNEQAQYTLSAARALKDAYDKAPASSTIKYVLAGLISDVSDGNISEGALMALATAGGAQDIVKKAEEIKADQEKQRATVDAVNKEFGTKFSSIKDIRKIVLKNHPEMTQSTDEEIIEMYKKDTSALKASTQPSGWWNN